MVDKFLEQYNRVFNTDDSIKACGRNECIQLIHLANKVDSSIGHGNIGTGHMHVDRIVDLKHRLTDNK